MEEDNLNELQEHISQLSEQSWQNSLAYIESNLLPHTNLPKEYQNLINSTIQTCYLIDNIKRTLEKNANQLNCEVSVYKTYIKIIISSSTNKIQINYANPNIIQVISSTYNIVCIICEEKPLTEKLLDVIYDCTVNTCINRFTSGKYIGWECKQILNLATCGSQRYCDRCTEQENRNNGWGSAVWRPKNTRN